MNQCILKDPHQRLGSLEALKEHPWFKNFDWEGLVHMTTKPLYVPEASEDNFDSKNVNEFVYDDVNLLVEHESELKKPGGQELFKDYYYDINK